MEEAKFVLSKSGVLKQYAEIRQYADRIFYSSKTNPETTPILEGNTDSNFLIHTIECLEPVKDMSKVLFLAQAWTKDTISELTRRGVTKFIVDNEVDLDTLLVFLKGTEVKIDLLLRVKLKERSIRTEKYFVFGMTVDVISRRVDALQDHKNIGKLGIHFFRGTQNVAEWNLVYEVGQMFSEETLQKIDVLNIGGRMPELYANTRKDIQKNVLGKIKEFKEWISGKNAELWLEPGRFICAKPIKLVTTISSIHKKNIVVNTSVYNTDTDAFTVPVKLLVEGECSKEKGDAYVVKGITPCRMDIFRYRVYLKEPKIGDELVFLNAGAYNFASDFCNLKKLRTEVVE